MLQVQRGAAAAAAAAAQLDFVVLLQAGVSRLHLLQPMKPNTAAGSTETSSGLINASRSQKILSENLPIGTRSDENRRIIYVETMS